MAGGDDMADHIEAIQGEVAHLREVIDLRLDVIRAEFNARAESYERRLRQLGENAAHNDETHAHLIDRAAFDEHVREFTDWRYDTDKAIAALRATSQANRVAIGVAIALLGVLVTVTLFIIEHSGI